MKPKLILVGGGGHCKVVISILKKLDAFEIIGISDIADNLGKNIFGIEIKYTDDKLGNLFKSGVKYAFVTLGSIGDPRKRMGLFDSLKKIGFTIPVIISPDAIVDRSVTIGEGTVVMPGVVINADVSIGKNCIINTKSSIDHDCIIEDHVHIAPGVTMSGNVKICEGVHLGTGSTIIQDKKIGKFAIIGAGAVVTKNVKSGSTMVGIPARNIIKDKMK